MFELQILKSPGESPKDYWFCSGSRCSNNSPIIPKSPDGCCRAVLPRGGEDKREGKAPKVATVRGIGCLAGTAAFPGPNCFPCCYLQDNFQAVTSSGTLLSSVLSDREVRALPILSVIAPFPLRAMPTTYEEYSQSNTTSQSAQAA